MLFRSVVASGSLVEAVFPELVKPAAAVDAAQGQDVLGIPPQPTNRLQRLPDLGGLTEEFCLTPPPGSIRDIFLSGRLSRG